MFKYIAIAYITLSCFSSSLHAEMELSTYQKYVRKGDPDTKMILYILGVAHGIYWMETAGDVRGHPRIFCLPKDFHFDDATTLKHLEDEITTPSKGRIYKSDTPIEFILINMFVNKYPCD